ncbi:MAG: hypothetical protein ACK4FW_13215, partial [Stenotrophomonas sp.]
MTTQKNKSLVKAFEDRFIEGALPQELEGFDKTRQAEAARFVGATGAVRKAGTPAIALESVASDDEMRRMRLAVVNDDMPFLVDSIAATIGAHGIAIDRIIHPVIAATRDAKGELQTIGEGNPESFVYIEMDRVDAKERRELESEIARNLTHVRHAVDDWPALKIAMNGDADRVAS